MYVKGSATGLEAWTELSTYCDKFQITNERGMRRVSEFCETTMTSNVVCDAPCRTLSDPIYEVLQNYKENVRNEGCGPLISTKNATSDPDKATCDNRFDSGYCSSVPFVTHTDMDTESNCSKINSDFSRTEEEIHKRLSSEGSLRNSKPCAKWEDYSTTDSGLGVDIYSSASEIDIEYFSDKDNSAENHISKDSHFQNSGDCFPWHEAIQQDEDGDTILHLAIVKGLSEAVFTIIQLIPHPAFLDIFNSLWQTPLHLAVLTDQPQVVRRLVVAGASVDIQDHNGNTPLHLACANGSLSCAQALVTPIHESEIIGARLLYTVSIPKLTTDLLEMKNFDGQCSIHLAASGIHTRVIRFLVQCGADVNARDGKSGRTVLHYAAEKQKADIAKFLLVTCQANVSETNYAGLTPLHIAWYHHRMNPTSSLSQLVNLLREHSEELFDLPKTDSDSESDISLDEDHEMSDVPSSNKLDM